MKHYTGIAILFLIGSSVVCSAQQKGQWVPGQYGLNAGVIPEPGFTYQNLALNYSAGTLNGPNGNSIPGLSGTYEFWVDENIFMFVPKRKFLGGYIAPYLLINVANGSLVADLKGTNLSANGGGAGLADTLVSPLTIGWHLKRVDFNVGYAFVAPTGRFTDGASDNVGSGYWGHNVIAGTTAYLTKNKGTSANLLIDWEAHGEKSGTQITPGQAVTLEWGLGQVLPLDKQMHKLLQVGFVGYDQWQVTDNSGSQAPRYSVHAVGFQTNLIAPAHGLMFFFKYYGEVSAKSHPLGRTIVFGGAWTLKIPKK
jgi:hypothetical protein